MSLTIAIVMSGANWQLVSCEKFRICKKKKKKKKLACPQIDSTINRPVYGRTCVGGARLVGPC